MAIKNALPTRWPRVGEQMHHKHPTMAARRGLQSFTAGKPFKGTGGSKGKSNWGSNILLVSSPTLLLKLHCLKLGNQS